MFEPRTPVTIIARFTPYPAVLLASDEGLSLGSQSVILRHRHLRQQQRVLSIITPPSHVGARPVRGKSLPPMYDKVPTYSTPSTHLIPPVPPVSTSAPPDHANTGQSDANRGTSLEEVPTASAISGKSGTLLSKRVASPSPEAIAISGFSGESSAGPLQVTRYERGIRSRNEKTTWFASHGRDLLSTPPDLKTACAGDLYVHTRASDGAKQAWLRSGSSHWTSIELCHPHPQLRGYILNFCANGEPSWVTKDTMRTYKGRTKKREKDLKDHEKTASSSKVTLGES